MLITDVPVERLFRMTYRATDGGGYAALVFLSVHLHNGRRTGITCAELAVLASGQRVEAVSSATASAPRTSI
ncbi:hypothetical protein [Amycolatopsis sp. NPDC049868]|uniref:hypothetical protein n=1 Tax=Amycolatopsis sp. NPDC049868 TaxID=3363934 RepID=UPI0037AA4CB6